jgi:hypothetical protein
MPAKNKIYHEYGIVAIFETLYFCTKFKKRNKMNLDSFYMCMMCDFRNRTAYDLRA